MYVSKGYENYKFNLQVFNSYCEKDAQIWSHCDMFLALPETEPLQTLQQRTPLKKKKRDRTTFELDSPEVKDSPPKTICLVTDSSEEEEEVVPAPEKKEE